MKPAYGLTTRSCPAACRYCRSAARACDSSSAAMRSESAAVAASAAADSSVPAAQRRRMPALVAASFAADDAAGCWLRSAADRPDDASHTESWCRRWARLIRGITALIAISAGVATAVATTCSAVATAAAGANPLAVVIARILAVRRVVVPLAPIHFAVAAAARAHAMPHITQLPTAATETMLLQITFVGIASRSKPTAASPATGTAATGRDADPPRGVGGGARRKPPPPADEPEDGEDASAEAPGPMLTTPPAAAVGGAGGAAGGGPDPGDADGCRPGSSIPLVARAPPGRPDGGARPTEGPAGTDEAADPPVTATRSTYPPRPGCRSSTTRPTTSPGSPRATSRRHPRRRSRSRRSARCSLPSPPKVRPGPPGAPGRRPTTGAVLPGTAARAARARPIPTWSTTTSRAGTGCVSPR